jgi:hypothetical protein
MQSADPDAHLGSLRSFIEDLEIEIAITRTLVEAGHDVDLAGFERQIGLLCAQALDLPPDQGRAVRQDLVDLLEEVNTLACELAPRAPGE